MSKTLHKLRYQIRDSPFFRLRSRRKLAVLLKASPLELSTISSSQEMYVRRWKHKKLNRWLTNEPNAEQSHEYRPIDIPNPRLKEIQARIGKLLSRISPPDFLFSPVKGRSYVDNAARHKESSAFWMLDVADYFPSCSANNIARFFHRDLECSSDVTAILVKLVTLNQSLSQGSPCSPILAYFSNRPMWLRIEECVSSAGCVLRVYADDITISGQIVRKSLIWEIKRIIYGSGLRLKKAKELSLISKPAEITGVVVKRGATYLPNRQLKRLNELRKERSGLIRQEDRKALEIKIAGRLSQKHQVEKRPI